MIGGDMIDWQQIALDIQNAGMPLRTASRELGMGLGCLGQIARGEIQEPRYSAGVKILRLHGEVA